MRIALRIAACAAMLHCAPASAGQSQVWETLSAPARQSVREPRTEARASRKHPGAPLDLTALTSHPLLAVAARYIGRRGPALGLPARLWCRDFVNLIVPRAGGHLANRSRRAIDTLTAGRRVHDPRPGDLAVMRHHVTVVVAVSGRQVIGLGGNQGHMVRVSRYALSRVIGFVRVI